MNNWPLIFPLVLTGSLTACFATETQSWSDQNKSPAGSHYVEVTLSDIKHIDGKLILGEKEWVYLPEVDATFRSRVDTGATTSSISAIDVDVFEKEGEDWVSFRVSHRKQESDVVSLPVERWVRIKQSSAEKGQRRPVVKTWIQIGDVKRETEFTLADRTHLAFPVLLGRSFFRDVAIVDVSQKYVQDKPKQ